MDVFTALPSVLDYFFLINKTAPFWLPVLLGYVAWVLWIDYRRREWISNIKWCVIEIRLPQEVSRSPLAMEIVLGALHDSGQGTWIDRYYKGRVMLWSSLEMVSIEGSVRFFIRLPVDLKNGVEAKIYSQYPGMEIFEVDDYTKNVNYEDGTWELFGTDFKLTKPDPYPILTYVDYGLTKPDLEPEYQIDPIAPLIEFLGSLKKNEHVWLQILIQPTKKRFKKSGSLLAKQDWKQEAESLVTKLRGETENYSALNIGTQNAIASIQRSVSKLGFDCGMRAIYLAKKDVFNPLNIGAMIGTTKQFSSEGLNGFAPNNKTKFDYPWEDYKGRRLASEKRKVFDAYRRRSYFYPPYKEKPFVLNSEELATVYHFPARVTDTPGLVRIESHKSEPPSNLPT